MKLVRQPIRRLMLALLLLNLLCATLVLSQVTETNTLPILASQTQGTTFTTDEPTATDLTTAKTSTSDPTTFGTSAINPSITVLPATGTTLTSYSNTATSISTSSPRASPINTSTLCPMECLALVAKAQGCGSWVLLFSLTKGYFTNICPTL